MSKMIHSNEFLYAFCTVQYYVMLLIIVLDSVYLFLGDYWFAGLDATFNMFGMLAIPLIITAVCLSKEQKHVSTFKSSSMRVTKQHYVYAGLMLFAMCLLIIFLLFCLYSFLIGDTLA